MSLVLSLETGLVSPQFHVRHDDFFETVRPSSQNLSHWQALAGFKDSKGIQAYKGATLPHDKEDYLLVRPTGSHVMAVTGDESSDTVLNENSNSEDHSNDITSQMEEQYDK